MAYAMIVVIPCPLCDSWTVLCIYTAYCKLLDYVCSVCVCVCVRGEIERMCVCVCVCVIECVCGRHV